MNEATNNTLSGKASRLTPCSTKVSTILQLVNLVPSETVLPALSGPLGNLDEEYLRFLKDIEGIPNYDSYWPDQDLQDRQDLMQRWTKSLLEWHGVAARALSQLPEPSRVYLWQEALGPQAKAGEHYGPDGLLLSRTKDQQQKLANRLGAILGKNSSKSIVQFTRFLMAKEENLRLYFWALYGLVKEYEFIQESRGHLSKIIRLCKAPAEERIGRALVGFAIDIKQTYTVDERGRFSPIKNRFTDALLDEDVDVTRIRECDNDKCKNFFWAGRSDQKCCTSQCNHTVHSRRTRQKYRQGYYQGGKG